jgi:predicted deacylase
MTAMQSTSTLDRLEWRQLALPAGPLQSQLPVRWADLGRDEGPRVTITCGIHGDEGPWSALAVRRALARTRSALRGTVRIVLAANPTAVEADARTSPLDHLDLNRTFPGSADGSHTERLAASLSGLVDGSDVLIDLHGGGSWCVNAFVFRFPGSEPLADAVGAPFVVDMPIRQGNLAGHVHASGTRIVAIEMGGRSVDEMRWVERLSRGIERVLIEAGVIDADRLDDAPSAPNPAVPASDLAVVRPAVGGVLVPDVRQDAIGTVVAGGTRLGVVHDLHTMDPIEELAAPYDSTALLLIRPHVTVLEGGAMTYVVGRASDSPS